MRSSLKVRAAEVKFSVKKVKCFDIECQFTKLYKHIWPNAKSLYIPPSTVAPRIQRTPDPNPPARGGHFLFAISESVQARPPITEKVHWSEN